MSLIRHPAGEELLVSANAIALERFDMAPGEEFARHVHDEHQLAWASDGVLMVDVGDRCWVLPPHLALWIPAGTWHATVAVRESVLQGIYVDAARSPIGWDAVTVVAMSPLARHLVEHLAGDLADAERTRAEAVLADVLRPVGGSSVELPMPRDVRARRIAELLLADPADRRGLEELGRQVGGSARTLLRLFLAETGMTFSEWRVHARLQAAVPLLAEGMPVARVADRVGYATPSAFVAAFRRVTGRTPAAYFARRTAG